MFSFWQLYFLLPTTLLSYSIYPKAFPYKNLSHYSTNRPTLTVKNCTIIPILLMNYFIAVLTEKIFKQKTWVIVAKIKQRNFFFISDFAAVLCIWLRCSFLFAKPMIISFSIQPWDLSISNYSTTISLENQLRSRYAMQLWNLNCSTIVYNWLCGGVVGQFS